MCLGKAGTQCGTSLGDCRQTEIVGLIPTVREGFETAESVCDRLEMVLLTLVHANAKCQVNLSKASINV